MAIYMELIGIVCLFIVLWKDTSFTYRSNSVEDFSNIQYIIALDSDTILPIGMAKK